MMSKKNVVVHLIWRNSNGGGFAKGYINFMKLRMSEYEHYFFVKNSDLQGNKWDPINVCDQNNIIYFDDLLSAMRTSDNLELLRKCSKIIVSGWLLSGKTRCFLLFSGLVSKTYLHFWDVNFSALGNLSSNIFHPRRALGKFIRHQLIKKSAGIINLIDGDFTSIMQTFPNHSKHFVAPMPGNPLEKIDFEAIRKQNLRTSAHRIIVGHSAFRSGLHIEAFHILEHLKNENIEIICPLSYGSSEYGNEVIAEGKRIFGGKFTPLTERIPKEEYINLLNTCDAGIFVTHYQQGMGNISILLRLGKKIYLRDNTAMWTHFVNTRGFNIYPVSELEGITLEQLANFPRELAYNNIKLADEYAASNYAVEQWRKVFDD